MKWNDFGTQFERWFFSSCHVHPVAARMNVGMRMNRNWADARRLLVKLFLSLWRDATCAWAHGNKQHICCVAQQKSSNCTKKTKAKHWDQKEIVDFHHEQRGKKHDKYQKKKTLNAASYIYYDHHPFLRRKKKLKNKRFDSNYVNVGVLPLYRQFHFSLMHHTESVPFLCGNCEERVKHFFLAKIQTENKRNEARNSEREKKRRRLRQSKLWFGLIDAMR